MDFTALIQQLFSDGQVLTVPWGIDYFSVLVGVLTGALFACDRKLDIIGTVVLGLITGYGGGIIRDLLLQNHGIYFMSHPDLVIISIVISAFVFYFRGLFRHLNATVFFADAFSVGMFALAGASKAVACGQGIVMSIMLGGITAVGGGALRDICVGETPGIFKESNFYALAGLGGATLYVLLAWLDCPLGIAGVLCVAVAVLLRYWSVYFNWKTSSEVDLTPKVTHAVRGAEESVKQVGRSLKAVATEEHRSPLQVLRDVFLLGGESSSVKKSPVASQKYELVEEEFDKLKDNNEN